MLAEPLVQHAGRYNLQQGFSHSIDRSLPHKIFFQENGYAALGRRHTFNGAYMFPLFVRQEAYMQLRYNGISTVTVYNSNQCLDAARFVHMISYFLILTEAGRFAMNAMSFFQHPHLIGRQQHPRTAWQRVPLASLGEIYDKTLHIDRYLQ